MVAHNAIAALVVAAVTAAGAAISVDFAKFDESQWAQVREDRFPSPGTFVQKDGCVLNAFPEGTSEKDLYEVKDGVGYTMRVLKGVEAADGRADLELELIDRAAPSIVFRAQVPQAQGDVVPVHGPLYSLVIFNHGTPQREYQGLNLWKWTGQAGQGGPKNWQKLAYWYIPITRDQKHKLAVEYRGELIRVFVDGKEIGGVRDTAALGAGKVGVVAMEGASKFYSFKFTPLK